MKEQEIHIRLRRQPQLPLVLAFPLLLVMAGIVVGVANFAVQNFVELVSFIVIPSVVWWVYARRQHRAGRTIRAVYATLGSGLLAISAFQGYAWNEHRKAAIESDARARAYAAEEPIREAQRKKACEGGVPLLKQGKQIEWYGLDSCTKYFTNEQSLEICRPLILRHAVPKYEWSKCAAFVDEVIRSRR